MQEKSSPVLLASVALTAISVGLLVVGLRGVHPQNEGPTGLISVMPGTYFLALIALSAAFVLALFDPRRPWWLPGLQTVVLVVATGGIAPIVETAPRIAVTYTHLGFAQYVGVHGQPLPPIDARADWPGGFALLAFLESISGSNIAFAIGRWAPLFFDLLWIFPLVALSSIITGDDRAKWIGAWIFLLANWTEEDYLSPQALDFTLYLAIVVVLLAGFAKYRSSSKVLNDPFTGRPYGAHEAPPRWRLLLTANDEPRTPWTGTLSAAQRGGLIALTVFLTAVATISHQLTPYMFVLVGAALVVFGRVRLSSFPWVAAVMAIGWVSFGAVSFWSGHLGLLFGSAGNVGQNFSSGVTGRIQGTVGHRLVLACRFGIALIVIGTALLGWLRDRIRGRTRLWLLGAIGAPTLLVAAQNYGGEGVIRSYLFLLPFAAAMAAALVSQMSIATPSLGASPLAYRVSPTLGGRRRGPIGSHARLDPPGPSRSRPVLLVGLAVLVVSGAILMSVVARFGADQVDQVTPGELDTMAWFYTHIPPGSAVYTVCVNLPWRYEDAASYAYRSLPAITYRSPTLLLNSLSPDGLGAYLITTPRQALCEEQLDGLPKIWLGTLRNNLQKTGRSKLVYSVNGDEIAYIVPAPPRRVT